MIWSYRLVFGTDIGSLLVSVYSAIKRRNRLGTAADLNTVLVLKVGKKTVQ